MIFLKNQLCFHHDLTKAIAVLDHVSTCTPKIIFRKWFLCVFFHHFECTQLICISLSHTAELNSKTGILNLVACQRTAVAI